MNAPDPHDGVTAELRDPDHDPRASLALEPDYVRRLTGLLRATSGETKPAISPINGQPLGDIPQSSERDVAEAFKRARKAQAQWAKVSLEERAEIFLRLHDIVLERQDEIMDLICWESGK